MSVQLTYLTAKLSNLVETHRLFVELLLINIWLLLLTACSELESNLLHVSSVLYTVLIIVYYYNRYLVRNPQRNPQRNKEGNNG